MGLQLLTIIVSLLLLTKAGMASVNEEIIVAKHQIGSNQTESTRSCSMYVAANGTCRCGTSINFSTREPAWCLNGYVSLPFCFCMSYNKEFNTTVVGFCAYRCHISSHSQEEKAFSGNKRYRVITKSGNWSTFNQEVCSSLQMNRTGQMCDQCMTGFAPSVYSFSSACVKCSTDNSFNWIKYIAVAYLPLTVFFIIVITFRINVASGAMNGFILTSQILISPAAMFFFHPIKKRAAFKALLTFYGIWNLDFFRTLHTPFCIHPNMTAIQTRALDYAVAVYPLLLVVVMYTSASLHYRYSIVVTLWKPFYRCFRFMRREWDIKNSLIQAFATFILLSYVKILNISLDLLTPKFLYDFQGRTLQRFYLKLDVTVVYFGKEHLPYAILALVMTFIFNILPLLLLCVFPCQCFHRCLNYFEIQREALREFIVVFHGEFKDEPRDYRYFAAFYLLLRIANLLCVFNMDRILYFPFGAILFVTASVLIALFKPYKKSRYNYLDTVMFCILAAGFLGPPIQILTRIMGSLRNLHKYTVLWCLFLLIQPLYGVGLLVYIFIPVQKLWNFIVNTLLAKLPKQIYSFIGGTFYAEAEHIPYRLEHMDENTPLIP